MDSKQSPIHIEVCTPGCPIHSRFVRMSGNISVSVHPANFAQDGTTAVVIVQTKSKFGGQHLCLEQMVFSGRAAIDGRVAVLLSNAL